MDTEELDRLEREAAEAVLAWLGDQKLVAKDGRPMVWGDGKPIAIDVLNAIAVLRRAGA